MTHEPRRLSDRDLLSALAEANHSSVQATVDFLEHLAEVDRRRLYLPEACASMFTYCVERLRLAEGAAHRRIRAARAGRRFPVVFDMLRRGELHLTAIALLQPLLTPDNHLQVLERARHRTTAAVKVLVAELAPRPDGPDIVRRLPASRPAAAAVQPAAVLPEQAAGTSGVSSPPRVLAPAPTCLEDTPLLAACAMNVAATVASAPLCIASSRPAPRIEPTAPDRFRISFTADQELTRLLDEVRDLLGHQVPRNDLATVFKRGLVTLREELLRQRTGRTRKKRVAAHGPAVGSGAVAPTTPQPEAGSGPAVPSATAPEPAGGAIPAVALAGASSAAGPEAASGTPERPSGSAGAAPADSGSRHVPNDIRRQVWARDEARCTFVNASGDRCSETSVLELDHLRPWALHREHTLDGFTLRCRRHNQWTAEVTYGAEHMEQARRARRGRRGGPVPGRPGGSG